LVVLGGIAATASAPSPQAHNSIVPPIGRRQLSALRGGNLPEQIRVVVDDRREEINRLHSDLPFPHR
jgi:hypothetical protein